MLHPQTDTNNQHVKQAYAVTIHILQACTNAANILEDYCTQRYYRSTNIEPLTILYRHSNNYHSIGFNTVNILEQQELHYCVVCMMLTIAVLLRCLPGNNTD